MGSDMYLDSQLRYWMGEAEKLEEANKQISIENTKLWQAIESVGCWYPESNEDEWGGYVCAFCGVSMDLDHNPECEFVKHFSGSEYDLITKPPYF